MNEWEAYETRDKKEKETEGREGWETGLSYRVGESTSAVRMREIRSQSAVPLSAGLEGKRERESEFRSASRRYITRLYH